jgi:hypothetical protein
MRALYRWRCNRPSPNGWCEPEEAPAGLSARFVFAPWPCASTRRLRAYAEHAAFVKHCGWKASRCIRCHSLIGIGHSLRFKVSGIRFSINVQCAICNIQSANGRCATRVQPDSRYMWDYRGLIAGTDPVAVEAIAPRIITEKRRALRGEPSRSHPWGRTRGGAEQILRQLDAALTASGHQSSIINRLAAWTSVLSGSSSSPGVRSRKQPASMPVGPW